ncbi:MAG: DUF494 domain-containing protein [Betaproteobacteria bacterium]|nr:DUF494 domain-containing protein [Betaproteobacteria bacterium]
MIDILVYLFENYAEFSDFSEFNESAKFTDHPKPDALARKLSAVGFGADEISVALDWLDGLKSAEVAEFSADPRAVRIYTREEQAKLGCDCLNFIAFLEAAGIVAAPLRELIVDRGMLLDDDPVPLARFKIVVLIVLWSRDKNLEPLIVEELLYGADPETMH